MTDFENAAFTVFIAILSRSVYVQPSPLLPTTTSATTTPTNTRKPLIPNSFPLIPTNPDNPFPYSLSPILPSHESPRMRRRVIGRTVRQHSGLDTTGQPSRKMSKLKSSFGYLTNVTQERRCYISETLSELCIIMILNDSVPHPHRGTRDSSTTDTPMIR